MFTLLLADRNWLLEHHAVEAFTRFAEGTNHDAIVPQCLRSEEMKNKVVSFLEKTGLVHETAAARAERAKREKGLFWASSARAPSGAAERPPLQPYAKRARLGSPLGEEYGAALQAAVGALDALESLLCRAPAPHGLLSELEMLHGRIDELKRRVL